MPYHVREWVEAAIELGHEVTVVTAIDPEFLKSINWDKNVDVRQVEYPGGGISNYFVLLKNFKATIQKVIEDNNPDLIYERFSQISPATAKIAVKNAIPYSTEVNGIIENELALSGASIIRQYFFKYIQKKVYSSCNKIITVTEQIKEWIIDKYSVPDKKVRTFNNGVNIDRFKPYDKLKVRKKFNIPENKFIIGFLGSLFPWCGLEHLIEAAEDVLQDYPDTLFLIGGGQEPVKSELEKMVKAKDLNDYFIFSGQISWENAPEFISAFDIGIETKEVKNHTSFSPLKIYSYLACEKPAIVPNITGVENLFKDNNIGFVFECGNSTDLAEKICDFRRLPEKTICELSRNARECVEKNYSWKKIVKESLEFAVGS